VSNELKMPFAEWLFRMSEKHVPYQARALAVYSVVFKVTANDELAILSGMDMKGVADKTYNKWKKHLADGGWVILKSGLIGRATTIEVSPAFETQPVIFTDVIARVPGKFGELPSVKITDQGTEKAVIEAVKVTDAVDAEPVETTRKNYDRPVKVTRKKYDRPVEITVEPVKITSEDGKNYEPEVKVTAEPEISPARPRAENNNNYINKYNNLPTTLTPSPTELDAAREGEEHIGHGVFVNCETIRHKNFSISLKAIEYQLVGAVPMDEIRAIAAGHALQWAADIEAGKPSKIPDNTANWIRASIQATRRKDIDSEVRRERDLSRGGKAAKTESTIERRARYLGLTKGGSAS